MKPLQKRVGSLIGFTKHRTLAKQQFNGHLQLTRQSNAKIPVKIYVLFLLHTLEHHVAIFK